MARIMSRSFVLPPTLVVSGWLLSCTPEEEPAPAPTPYLADAPAPSSDPLPLDALEEALLQLLPTVLATHARPAFDAYSAAMGHATGGCPERTYEGADAESWYDRCTTDGGATFDGYGYAGVEWRDDGETVDEVRSMYGSGQITWPGGRLTLSGYATTLEGTTIPAEPEAGWIGETHHYSSVSGSFATDASQWSDAWIGGSGDLDFSYWIARYHYDDARLASIEGAMPTDAGPIVAALWTDVFYISESLGGCEVEPGGELSLRDDQGLWYDLVLHGPGDWGEEFEPALCDGCAELWVEGLQIGELCVDWSPLWTWGESPW